MLVYITKLLFYICNPNKIIWRKDYEEDFCISLSNPYDA